MLKASAAINQARAVFPPSGGLFSFSRWLGTDRRRSRQRTVVVSDVSYATVYLVRHTLSGIERATCSTDRLALLRTASCGSLVESVLRPGGWENMCRLMCHCVRHVSLDNKYGRSVKAIHSSRERWTACTELCAGTHQEEPYGKKSSMGSENVKPTLPCPAQTTLPRCEWRRSGALLPLQPSSFSQLHCL